MGSVLERLENYIVYEPFTGCWLWTGSLNTYGYGQFSMGRETVKSTHRWLYEYHNGKITEDLVLDHLCRTRSCCNPKHLAPKTNKENILAPGAIGQGKLNSYKTHCPKGHELSGNNLVAYRLKIGKRECKECRSNSQREKRKV